MKKHNSFVNGTDTSLKKFYILTHPAKLSDLAWDEMDESDDSNWREKSKQLQARRWRKIRHQEV